MLNAKKIIKDTPKPSSKKMPVEPLSGIKVKLPDDNDEDELPKVENKKRADESDSCGDEDGDENEKEDTNQFKLIYPSERNTEFDYFMYLKHAHRLYEQFTGSYSKKRTVETTPEVKEPTPKEKP